MQAIGLGAAIDYVESVGRDAIKAHEDALLAYAMERLGELNWLRIFGRAKGKGSIVSFNVEGAHPHDVSTDPRPLRRGGQGRHPLRRAAAGPLRRHRHCAGVVCHV